MFDDSDDEIDRLIIYSSPEQTPEPEGPPRPPRPPRGPRAPVEPNELVAVDDGDFDHPWMEIEMENGEVIEENVDAEQRIHEQVAVKQEDAEAPREEAEEVAVEQVEVQEVEEDAVEHEDAETQGEQAADTIEEIVEERVEHVVEQAEEEAVEEVEAQETVNVQLSGADMGLPIPEAIEMEQAEAEEEAVEQAIREIVEQVVEQAVEVVEAQETANGPAVDQDEDAIAEADRQARMAHRGPRNPPRARRNRKRSRTQFANRHLEADDIPSEDEDDRDFTPYGARRRREAVPRRRRRVAQGPVAQGSVDPVVQPHAQPQIDLDDAEKTRLYEWIQGRIEEGLPFYVEGGEYGGRLKCLYKPTTPAEQLPQAVGFVPTAYELWVSRNGFQVGHARAGRWAEEKAIRGLYWEGLHQNLKEEQQLQIREGLVVRSGRRNPNRV